MKILYSITSLAHKRVFQSFVGRIRMDQVVVGPKPVIFDGVVPEDYSEFGIKKVITYASTGEMQGVVERFIPDVYVHADLSPIQKKLRLPKKCKRVYVSHGMVPTYAKNMLKDLGTSEKIWGGCDLYCGGTTIFKDWIKTVTRTDNCSVVLNALPQLDVLFELKQRWSDKLKGNLLRHSRLSNPAAVLFFGGFCCKDRVDFWEHNEDYFRSCIELERVARKNNWLVFIKPRQAYADVAAFLSAHKHSWGGWPKKYAKTYADIQSSPNLQFIKTSSGLHYYYFASDVMVINGCSTIEVEGYAIGKPMVVINSKPQALGSDSFGVSHCDGRYNVSDYELLEETLVSALNNPNKKREAQCKILKDLDLSFDGQHHQRIFNAMVGL